MYVTATGGRSPSVYPNPASDILNIEIDQEIVDAVKALLQASGAKYSNNEPVFDIRMYNIFGNTVRSTTTNGGTVQFDVSVLPDGFYYIHIYDGVSNKPEKHAVIVKH